MKRVLIFGNSGGIGSALQGACIAKGYDVSGLSRSQHDLDLSDENKIISAIKTLDGSFDQIFITTGALVVNSAEPKKLFGISALMLHSISLLLMPWGQLLF